MKPLQISLLKINRGYMNSRADITNMCLRQAYQLLVLSNIDWRNGYWRKKEIDGKVNKYL